MNENERTEKSTHAAFECMISIILERFERQMFSFYDYFRAISPFLASDLRHRQLISDQKIVMIPPAIDLSVIPHFTSCTNDLAYFGVLEKFEGVDILVRSFARVLRRYPNVKLHIFGTGPLEESLHKIAVELHIASSLVFYGGIPRDNLLSHFNKFSIAVFPRINGYGHIPIKVLEALAAGKAVIATNVRGISDVFSSHAVLFVEPLNETQLSEAIIMLLEDEKLKQRLIMRGLSEVKRFDASKTYNKLFNLVIGDKIG